MSHAGAIRSDERIWPDVASSTTAYAKRFRGSVGEFFLNVQESEVLRRIADQKSESVLDVGGGHGQLAMAFAESGLAVTVTGSESRCEERLREAMSTDDFTFVESGLFPLPFEDRSFDAATSFRTMSHLPDWPRLLAELCRVARDVVLIDFAEKSWASRYAGIVLKAKRTVEKDTRSYLTQSLQEVDDAFRANGYRIEHVFRQFAIPMAIHRLLRVGRITSAVENTCRAIGLTQRIGGPLIVTAVPIKHGERA